MIAFDYNHSFKKIKARVEKFSAVSFCQPYWFMSVFTDLEDEEEMKVLEDEINELHKSNSQLENEMSQLKAQISNMENKMSQQERENQVLEDKTNNINDYLAYMRKSLVNCLQDVKLPGINETICEENFRYLHRPVA